ncbi:MAG: periplasmic heavy metal sensor [Brevundimonas sp.]|nr:MAG: periplasmic heavy metal sensor [Brevundimonas sp.]
MNNKTLAIALAVSVGLNLFGLGAAGAFWLSQSRTDADNHREMPSPRQRGANEIVSELPEAVRVDVRTRLRASALAARPDFEEARSQRRAAVAAAKPKPMTPIRFAPCCRHRDRPNCAPGSTGVRCGGASGELSPQDRRTLSRILVRRGRGEGAGGPRRHRGDGRRAPPPPASNPAG